jgi:hypothetical protein
VKNNPGRPEVRRPAPTPYEIKCFQVNRLESTVETLAAKVNMQTATIGALRSHIKRLEAALAREKRKAEPTPVPSSTGL